MALHAGELRRELAAVLRLLRPFPGRAEFAARLALICALTTLVTEIYQTPEPALTTYVAFFVMKPDRMSSIVISVVMALLITIVIGATLLATMFVIDQPLSRVATMAAISFGLLFLASASKLKEVGGIMALITAYALDLVGKAQIGELATRALLYAWMFVTIPVAVSLVVNLLLGPPPRRLAERALAHRLNLAAAMLRNPDHDTRELFAEVLAEGVTEIKTWVKLAGVEKTSPPEDIGALRQATESITPILLLVDALQRITEMTLPSALKEKLAQTFDEMASILSAGSYPVEIRLDSEGFELGRSENTFVADIKEALARFTQAPLPDLPPPKAETAKPGFFLPDAFTNPLHVHFALKTTAAAMFCYAVYSLLDWQGIHTSLITVYIVALGTTAETLEKLTLRVLGCLIGAAAGTAAIVFLIPDITSIGALMAVVFLATLASGWVAAGSPRISYAGFQIAFAFFLSAVQGPAPAFDMTIARDRVVGMLLANVVVYLVFTKIWPVTVTGRIDTEIASLLRKLSAMATAARSRRGALAADACAALGAIEQDLILAKYEPLSVRATNHWLGARSHAAAEIAALVGPLFVRASENFPLGAEIARRLDMLAARFGDRSAGQGTDAKTVPGPSGSPGKTVVDSLDRQIVARIQNLEQALLGPYPPQGSSGSYAPA